MPYALTLDTALYYAKRGDLERILRKYYRDRTTRTFKAVTTFITNANELAETNAINEEHVIHYLTAKMLTEGVDRKLFNCDTHLNEIPLRKEIDDVVEAVYLDNAHCNGELQLL